MGFKDHDPEKRLAEAERVLEKYPNRIPVIVEKNKDVNSNIPDIDKNKYLVPHDISLGQFLFIIRKRIKLKPEEAMFMYIDGILPSNTKLIGDLYAKYKDKDKFLYIKYTGENVFG